MTDTAPVDRSKLAARELAQLFAYADRSRLDTLLQNDDLSGFYKALGITSAQAHRLYSDLALDFLPVKAPFAFVDEIDQLEPGVRVVAKGGVDRGDPNVAANFDTNSMPAMLQLETLAQTSAIGLLARAEYEDKLALCARIGAARFKRVVQPGDELTVEAEVLARRRLTWEACASVDNDPVVTADLTLFVDHTDPKKMTEEDTGDTGIDLKPPPSVTESHKVAIPRDQLKAMFPGRQFAFIDTIDSLVAGKSATATRQVRRNEWFFKGHFPGNHIMPGMLQLQALAETTAVVLLSQPGNEHKEPVFTGIDQARFKRIVRPGTELTLWSEVKALPPDINGRQFYEAAVSAWTSAEKLAAHATLTFYLDGLPEDGRIPQPA